jgi:Zn-dependent protease/CBS domain-containing protein
VKSMAHVPRSVEAEDRIRTPRRSTLKSGFRVGRIFGIEIHIDPSWIFIFVLVTWNLAAGFAAMHPGWGISLQLGLALVAALLFFGSVLTHELSHSLVARARGLPVKRITLFLFGGVSNIEREPTSPGSEFLISVVGPLSSIVLGGVFLILGRTVAGGRGIAFDNPAAAFSGLSPGATMLLWLGSINIILGLFNLVPGFPLDGGRILRSILWASTQDLRRATRWASQVGQLVGWIFVFSGLAMVFGARVPVFGSGVAGGIWIALIGWFLRNAAASSYRQLLIEDLLEDVPVARLMRSQVPTVRPDLSVSDLVYDFMLGTDERAFPVLEEGKLAGLVTIEDVRKVPRDAWPSTSVAQIMTPADKLSVISPRQDASEALHELSRRDVRQLPVVENGKLVGLLRRRDIVRWLRLQSNVTA